MAEKTLVEIDARNLQRRVSKITREYRYFIMVELSKMLDRIRHTAADKYIIKNIVGKRMPPWKMAKLQKVHPTRLTERTGRMLEMMRHDTKWSIPKDDPGKVMQSTARQFTMGLRGQIKAMAFGRLTSMENYEATLNIKISENNPFIGKGFYGGGRILAVYDGKILRDNRKEDIYTLRARFFHEHGTVKHPKRQSFTPAARDEINSKLKPIFASRLQRILAIRG